MARRLQNPEQHNSDGWAKRAAELDADVQILQAALKEALEDWYHWVDTHVEGGHEAKDRIAELRKLTT